MVHRLVGLLVFFSTEAALAAPRTYEIDEGRSSASAHVGKTGIFSFAGHEHVVLAQKMQGEVLLDAEDLSRSSVDVVVDARSLKVRPEGEPEGDAPKVEQAMRAPNQLDVNGHRTLHFRSTQVTGKPSGPNAFQLSVAGELTLHGVTRPFTVPIQVTGQEGSLIATGKLLIKLTDFGIEPTGAAGGTVKVENDVPVELKIVAREVSGR